jgi:hypothetical protein
VPDSKVQRRVENEARFRDANERVSDTARRLDLDAPLPFLCECERPTCMELVHLTPGEYEHVREFPRRFLYAPGHDEGIGHSHVVEEHAGYAIVEKDGKAGDLAEKSDPRS